MGFNMAGSGLPARGIHLVEVIDAKEKTSTSSGNAMWALKLAYVSDRRSIVDDWWMLSGKMEWATRKKLLALGFPAEGNVEAHDLIGRRFYAAIVHQDGRNGDKEARINGRADGSVAGIWSESNRPLGADESSATDVLTPESQIGQKDDGSVPF